MPDGERIDPVVHAEHCARVVDDRSRPPLDATAEKRRATAARDEAHVHALLLVRGSQAQIVGAGAHLGLRHLADRKPGPVDLPPSEHVEHVRLVLVVVDPTGDGATVRGVDDAGVVTGRDLLETELVGALEQPPELHGAVAFDAGIRRLSRRVHAHVGRDDVRVEVVGEIEHVVRDAELRRDAPRVFYVGRAAAAGVALAAPQLERDAGDVVAFGLQHGGCDRRVDPAAHHDENTAHACPLSALRAGPLWPRSLRRDTRLATLARGRSHETVRGLGNDGERGVDVGGIGRVAEAETDRRSRPVRPDAHGEEHVRRIDRAGSARRSRRCVDGLLIERDEQRLGLDARETAVEDSFDAMAGIAVDDESGNRACKPGLELVAQLGDTRALGTAVGIGRPQGRRETDDRRDVLGSRASGTLVATTVDQRHELHAVTNHERADALRTAELVPGDGHEIATRGPAAQVEPARRLHRVGVQHGLRCPVAHEPGYLCERLDDAGLVVYEHHRHNRGLIVERIGERSEIHQAGGIGADLRHPKTFTSEPVARAQHRLVLDPRGDDAVGPGAIRAAHAAPFTARLSPSLPPPVKTTSRGSQPHTSATVSRAASSAVFDVRAAACMPDGFA